MGNHIHLLIQEDKEPVEQVMKRIGTRFVYWYNVRYQRVGHLFQDRFKSEPVEDIAYFATVVRYIHQNPIKAELSKHLSDYKFSSYNGFFDNSDWIEKDFVFGIIPKELFEPFHNETTNDKCLEIEENPIVKVTDEQIYLKCKSVADLQNLNIKHRNRCLIKFRENGLSTRQISRLTGVSFGIVRKFY